MCDENKALNADLKMINMEMTRSTRIYFKHVVTVIRSPRSIDREFETLLKV